MEIGQVSHGKCARRAPKSARFIARLQSSGRALRRTRRQALRDGTFVRERFRDCGITLEPSERTKSDLYLELLPVLSSGKIRLLDSKRLLAQLIGLERRTARSGKDSVDHGPGGHDDVANAVCGSLLQASVRPGVWIVGEDVVEFARRRSLAAQQQYRHRYW